MVFSEVLQELGLHMHIYVLVCYSCLATGGMLQELFIEIPSLVLTLKLVTKLNLVYSRNLVTKPQEESQEGLNQTLLLNLMEAFAYVLILTLVVTLFFAVAFRDPLNLIENELKKPLKLRGFFCAFHN